MILEEISYIFLVLGIGIICFTVTLFFRETEEHNNILLIILLLCLIPFFIVYHSAFTEMGIIKYIIPFTNSALVLIGPVLYRYLIGFYNQKIYKHSFKEYAFFLIFIFLQILSLCFLPEYWCYFSIIFSISAFIHISIYVYKILKYQYQSIEKLKHFYSSFRGKKLNWINVFVISLLLVLVLDFISGVIIALTNFKEIFLINNFVMLFLVWFLGLKGLSQKKIKDDIHSLDIKDAKKKIDICDTILYHNLKSKLNHVLTDEKLYLREDINLNILSDKLESSPKIVSTLLNKCMDTSFYDLINSYRIEEFKMKVHNGESSSKTILALALESGFNSKTTFNRVFKQNEGITPSQYVKNISK